jgi:hypothetical protein
MTTIYAWRCSVCETSNAAGVDTCAECGIPATTTGTAILEARRKRTASRQPGSRQYSDRPEPGALAGEGLGPVLATVGVFLIALGLVSLAHGHWPGFLPPQLDALEALSSAVVAQIGVLPAFALGLVSGVLLVAVASVLAERRGEA